VWCCGVHEQVQLLVQQPQIPLAIHLLPLVEKLEAQPALPAEAAPGYDLQGVFDRLLCEPGVESVRPHRPPALGELLSKVQLEVTLFRKNNFFSLLNPPIPVLHGGKASFWYFILWVRKGFLAIFL
jgi:hypothetical protein